MPCSKWGKQSGEICTSMMRIDKVHILWYNNYEANVPPHPASTITNLQTKERK